MKKLLLIAALAFMPCAWAFETNTAGGVSSTTVIVNKAGEVNAANPLPVSIVSGGGGGGSALPNATTNVTQFGGAAVITGTGVSGAGIPRITVSSDSFPLVQNVTGYRGTLTDRSGTITTAGVSQTLSALNINRVHFEIQANLANTTPLCFNFTAAASATANTRCLLAGATYNMDVPNFVSTELITVWSATAGAAWSAKEF